MSVCLLPKSYVEIPCGWYCFLCFTFKYVCEANVCVCVMWISFLTFLFQSVSHQKRMGFWEEFHLNSFIFLSGTPSLCCLGWVFGVCKSTPSTWCWCDYRNCKEWEYLSQEKRCVGFDLFAYVCLFGCGCVAAHAEIGKFFFSRFSLICRNLEDILIFNYLSVWVWM